MAKIKGFGALGKMYGLESPPEKKSQPQRNSQPQRTIYHASPPPKNSSAKQATAPYNFVSLPEKVLPAQFEDVAGFKKHVGKNGKGNISGEILLDITTLTPLFIGGNDTKSFAPVGTPIIPGSSLRGMVKNLFKIVTCGAFRGISKAQGKGEDFNDEHIYFRCIMPGKYDWSKELNRRYNYRMTDKATGRKKAHPGFLICREDDKFFIAPSLKNDCKEDRTPLYEYRKKFQTDKSCVKWEGTKAYIFTGTGGKKKFVRHTFLEYVDWCREHWIPLPEEVQNSYRHDRNRRGVDLFTDKGILTREDLEQLTGKTFPDVNTLIPCHFLEDHGQVTAFGHGQCFRIPYKNSIGDAVKISGNEAVDFADAVFGCTELWASRVYFEDAAPVSNLLYEDADKAHPLMQPNPTSYQLYLKQDGDALKHWDTNGAQIRGYKLYWHNPKPDWKANDFEREENANRLEKNQEPLIKEMTPLKAGNKFAAKIRFQNLSAEELGALMAVFYLSGAKDTAYKIGMGKSLGLGSIRIKPTLFIEGAQTYTELFGADGWQNPCHEKNPAVYLDAFTDYLKARDMYAIWLNVVSELKKILDWSTTTRDDWSKKIEVMRGSVKFINDKKIMELDERFKTRESLPTIFQIVDKC